MLTRISATVPARNGRVRTWAGTGTESAGPWSGYFTRSRLFGGRLRGSDLDIGIAMHACWSELGYESR
eukprot:7759115-Pyramimonas_sp.AAC.1